MTRTSPDGRVTDYSADATHMNAHLWDFDIDGAVLKSNHVAWLESAALRVNAHPRFIWNISTTGAASLTGVNIMPNNGYNWMLAGRRAAAVDTWLRGRLSGLGLSFNPPFNNGTNFAHWAKHRVGVENDEDRGVYVVITTDSTPAPPPRAPVSVPMSRRWGIRYSSGGNIAFGVGAESALIDIADLDNHIHAYYEYSGKAVVISPEEPVLPVSVTMAGSWTTFETTAPVNVADFEGPASYSSIGAGPISSNKLTVTLPGAARTTTPSIAIDTGTTFGLPGASKTIPGTGYLHLKSRRPFAYHGTFPP